MLLEQLKSLDSTEVRASKMLDAKDLDKLHSFKQSLVVMGIAYLSREHVENEENVQPFLNYVLNESKVIRTVLKKKVIQTQQEFYVERLKQNYSTVSEYLLT